mmetsp:Transcript_45708/g.52816  ORF Transcript_45708/g.52816 Transcript_45708/m.52816 type:complete len:311 (-) Transcript_45708:105-1037(-)
MWYPEKDTCGGDFADKMVIHDKEWSHATFVEKACEFAVLQKAARAPWYVVSHDANGSFTTRASCNVDAGRELFGDLVHHIPVFVKSVYKLGAGEQGVGCVIRRADGIQQMVAIRHSCEPNLTLVHGQTLTCAAKRQISAGEELTIDYSTLRDELMPHFACKCGTAHCRGVIISQPPMPRVVDLKLLRKLLRDRKRVVVEAKRALRASSSTSSSAAATPSEQSVSAAERTSEQDGVVASPKQDTPEVEAAVTKHTEVPPVDDRDTHLGGGSAAETQAAAPIGGPSSASGSGVVGSATSENPPLVKKRKFRR